MGPPAVSPSASPRGPVRRTFRRSQRLSHARQFDAVYDAKMRKVRGGLVMFARPNAVGFLRLGLSVGRNVGTAVERNRIKRLLREAFRLENREWFQAITETGGVGYDLVVSVRPHRILPLSQYRQMLAEMVADLHREWMRRGRKSK
jgi:ribonuclease P protein component